MGYGVCALVGVLMTVAGEGVQVFTWSGTGSERYTEYFIQVEIGTPPQAVNLTVSFSSPVRAMQTIWVRGPNCGNCGGGNEYDCRLSASCEVDGGTEEISVRGNCSSGEGC